MTWNDLKDIAELGGIVVAGTLVGRLLSDVVIRALKLRVPEPKTSIVITIVDLDLIAAAMQVVGPYLADKLKDVKR